MQICKVDKGAVSHQAKPSSTTDDDSVNHTDD